MCISGAPCRCGRWRPDPRRTAGLASAQRRSADSGRSCAGRSIGAASPRSRVDLARTTMKAWFLIVFTGLMFGSLGLCTKYLTTRGSRSADLCCRPFWIVGGNRFGAPAPERRNSVARRTRHGCGQRRHTSPAFQHRLQPAAGLAGDTYPGPGSGVHGNYRGPCLPR